MAEGYFLRGLPFTVLRDALTNPAFPATALATPQPKQVWTTQSANFASVVVDFGEDQLIDTVAMLFHNNPAAGVWGVWTRTAAQGDFPNGYDTPADSSITWFNNVPWAAPATGAPTRRHAVHARQGTVAARYMRLTFAAAMPFVWRSGVLMIGRRIEPIWGAAWGGGRRIEDQSIVRKLPGGESAGLSGAKVPVIRAPFKDLADAEWDQLWALQLAAGESEPILYVERDDRHEGIHYGQLVGLDFHERVMADKSAWEARIRYWL